jgi:hypothetical protein
VVIKYGGHAMGEESVAKLFAADVVLLKMLGVHPWWCTAAARRSPPGWRRPA